MRRIPHIHHPLQGGTERALQLGSGGRGGPPDSPAGEVDDEGDDETNPDTDVDGPGDPGRIFPGRGGAGQGAARCTGSSTRCTSWSRTTSRTTGAIRCARRAAPIKQIDRLIPQSLTPTAYLNPNFAEVWTKLRVWQEVQFDQAVYLDSDLLILQNIDELFEVDSKLASVQACICNPLKVPKVSPFFTPAGLPLLRAQPHRRVPPHRRRWTCRRWTPAAATSTPGSSASGPTRQSSTR